METEKVALDQLLTDKMRYLAERQRVLAQNVANAETPNFKPNDLAPFDFKTTLQQVTPAVTQANHIAVARQTAPGIAVVPVKSAEILPNGNGVNIEDEMMKVSNTGASFQEMVTLLKRWQTMLKTATGRNG